MHQRPNELEVEEKAQGYSNKQQASQSSANDPITEAVQHHHFQTDNVNGQKRGHSAAGQSNYSNESNSSRGTRQKTKNQWHHSTAADFSSPSFITGCHINGSILEQFPIVNEAYSELDKLVQQLESRVDGVIERHDAEFLIAYKDQMNRIQKELLDMKNRITEQDRMMKAGSQLADVEKQLTWFRDESLKLYNKLAVKDKQIADFKQIVQDQLKDSEFKETQITLLKQKVRNLAKKLAQEETTVTGYQPQPAREYHTLNDKPFKQPQHGQATTRLRSAKPTGGEGRGGVKLLVHQSQANSLVSKVDHHTQSQQDFIAELVGRFGANDPKRLERDLSVILRNEEDKKNRQVKALKDRLERVMKEKNSQNVVRSDLERFFFECIETVRKQILRRKAGSASQRQTGGGGGGAGGAGESGYGEQLNFYLNSVKDYSIFRNEDKAKILELLLANEKLVLLVYQKIFPPNKLIAHSTTLPIEGMNVFSNNLEELSVQEVNKETEDLVKVIEKLSCSSSDQLNLVKRSRPTTSQTPTTASRRQISAETLKNNLRVGRNESLDRFKEIVLLKERSMPSSVTSNSNQQKQHQLQPPSDQHGYSLPHQQARFTTQNLTQLQFRVF